MRWIYRFQQILSLTAAETNVILTLVFLLLLALVLRTVRTDSRPIPPDAYEQADRLLRSTASRDQDMATGFEEHNVLPGPAIDLRLDLNRATEAELELLPRIGPALARRIVDYRTEHGPFAEVQELTNVKGIGAKTVERIETLLYVSATGQ